MEIFAFVVLSEIKETIGVYSCIVTEKSIEMVGKKELFLCIKSD